MNEQCVNEPNKKLFNWSHLAIVLIVGILIGIVLSLILFMIMYYTRSMFFEYCAHNAPYCTINDYIPDAATAKRYGYPDEKILTVDELNRLVYIPPRSNSSCIVNHDVTVVIDYPKHCVFTGVDGCEVEYIQSSDNPAVYTNGNNTVLTRSHCNTISSTGAIMTKGRPLAKW